MWKVIEDDPRRCLVAEWEGRQFKVDRSTSKAFFLLRDRMGLTTVGMLERLMRSRSAAPWRLVRKVANRMVVAQALWDRWRHEELFLSRNWEGKLFFVRRPLDGGGQLWGVMSAPSWMESLDVAKRVVAGGPALHVFSGQPLEECIVRAA